MTDSTDPSKDWRRPDWFNEDELRDLIREHRDSLPTCHCGETMNAEYRLTATVVRCPTGNCRCEGAMSPYWLRRRLPWHDAE